MHWGDVGANLLPDDSPFGPAEPPPMRAPAKQSDAGDYRERIAAALNGPARRPPGLSKRDFEGAD